MTVVTVEGGRQSALNTAPLVPPVPAAAPLPESSLRPSSHLPPAQKPSTAPCCLEDKGASNWPPGGACGPLKGITCCLEGALWRLEAGPRRGGA